jgi:predicted AAA+ superfamily ATPase
MQIVIPRLLAPLLVELFQQYPVLTLTGPRQSGKTTLVQHLFKDLPYVNLEAPDIRAYAQADGRGFIEQYRTSGAIFDEVQRVPQLLSYVQVVADENDRSGQFVLTGSHQMELHSAITQSLAGRTTLQRLLPLSLRELAIAGIHASVDEAIFQGGLPRIFAKGLDPTRTYRDYLHTYVERDVRSLSNVKDLALFEKFLGLCAGRIGQLLNVSSLATEVGVSAPTIQHWISILEASFLIFRVQPYHENFGKRLIKAAKLYFTDTGLACYLLGLRRSEEVARDPLRGQLFENLVILELLKAQYARGYDANLYFFRDAHGHEVDLLIPKGRHLMPIEIKSSQTFSPDFLKGIEYLQALAGSGRCQQPTVIYGGVAESTVRGVQICSYNRAGALIQD